ncbi:hypothetical protein [Kosakonia sp. YIM B13611]|uniref:hypothetical protein n=1 Tax=unclassified Kosakonia TaxID=2632876 RepID=UPI0036B09D78
MMHLEMLDKHLAEKMKVVSEEKRRSAVRVACELAVQLCPVNLPVVDESLRQLLSGYKLSIEQVSKLDGLAAQLDEEYFNLHNGQNEEMELNPQALHLFSQARAVSALAIGGRDDSIESATEAIYEAASAIDDGQILNAVFSVLSEM